MAFVPGRLLEELISGSYESQIEKLSLAVTENYRKFGGRGGDVHLVATFPGHALVANEGGEFYRGKYTSLDDGSFVFTEVEQAGIPVMTKRSEIESFVAESAGAVVSSLFSGDYDSAREMVRELALAGQFARSASPVETIRDQLDEVFDEGRPWRKLYEQHGTSIRKFLWGASGASFRHAPKPKYQDLYREDTDKASGYHGAVQGDLVLMAEKLGKMWESVTGSWSTYDESLGMFRGIEVSGIVENFEGFAQDFIDELKMVSHLVEQASQDDDPNNTFAMAMIYDAVARQYPNLDVASRLLQRAATELAA